MLARYTLGVSPPWSPRLEVASGYAYAQFRSCAASLYTVFKHTRQLWRRRTLLAVHKKFADPKFERISELSPPLSFDL